MRQRARQRRGDELTAPNAGTVVEARVATGQQSDAAQVLVVVEHDPDEH